MRTALLTLLTLAACIGATVKSSRIAQDRFMVEVDGGRYDSQGETLAGMYQEALRLCRSVGYYDAIAEDRVGEKNEGFAHVEHDVMSGIFRCVMPSAQPVPQQGQPPQ